MGQKEAPDSRVGGSLPGVRLLPTLESPSSACFSKPCRLESVSGQEVASESIQSRGGSQAKCAHRTSSPVCKQEERAGRDGHPPGTLLSGLLQGPSRQGPGKSSPAEG